MGYDPVRHGPRRVVGPGFHDQVRDAVRRVPPGAVTTYGDVAAFLGLRSAARQVGYALAGLGPDHADVPWHRVLNRDGRLSARGDGAASAEQAARLRAEGVELDASDRVADFAARRHQF